MTESRAIEPLDKVFRQLQLSAWYAEPMSEPQARALLKRVQAAQQRAYARADGCPACPLLEMIGRFWLERPIESHYRNLLKTGTNRQVRILTELGYGQLRMSRRLSGAMEHLRRGFAQAARLLPAADYFEVLRRHELLTHLPLAALPSRPMDLGSLLREAAVIRELKRCSGKPLRPPKGRGGGSG